MYTTSDNRRLTTTVALLALLAVGLVATAGVGTATTAASSTNHALDASASGIGTSADVTDPDVQLNVTRLYYPTPENGSSVKVEYIIHNPGIAARSDVDEVRFDLGNAKYTNVGGLEQVENDTYRLNPHAYTARITLFNEDIGVTGEREVHGFARVAPDNLRDCRWYYDYGYGGGGGGTGGGGGASTGSGGAYEATDCDERQGVVVDADTAPGTSFDVRNFYDVAGQGFVTSGNDEVAGRLNESNVRDLDVQYFPLVVMGDFETYSAEENGRNVTLVVPDHVEMRESPETVVQSVADGAAELEAGDTSGPRYLIARSDTRDVHGYTTPTGARWAVVNEDQPVHTLQNTWLEEYVHTTDDTRTNRSSATESITWFHEAYSVWARSHTALQSGYGSYEGYRANYEHAGNDAGTYYHDKYHSGALFLSALDRRIHAASNGENDLTDLVDRLRTYDGLATEDDILQLVGELGDDSVEDFARRTVGDTSNPNPVEFPDGETPSVPSQSAYEARHGPVPDADVSLENVTVATDRGNRTVHTQRPIAVHPNETVRFTFRVHNDGSALGKYHVQLREPVDEPLNADAAVFDDATGQVPAGETATVTVERTFTARDTYEMAADAAVPNDYVRKASDFSPEPYEVTVVPEDESIDPDATTIVRENGTADSPDHAAVVTNDTQAVVVRTNRTQAVRYGAGQKNVYVNDSWTYTTYGGGTVTVPYRSYKTDGAGIVTVDDLTISPGETMRVSFWNRSTDDVQYLRSLEPVGGSAVPNDPDGDGLYEDVDGDGDVDTTDANVLFQHRNDESVSDYVRAYDFSGNGQIDIADASALYGEAS